MSRLPVVLVRIDYRRGFPLLHSHARPSFLSVGDTDNYILHFDWTNDGPCMDQIFIYLI